MPRLTEIITALYGAWRLARFDGQGLAFFEQTMAAFWRSFFAAVLVAPMYALTLAYAVDRPAGSDPVRFGLAEMVGYVLSWVAFPLLMEGLSRRLGCRSRYPLFITAYNWASVVEHALLLPILLGSASGFIPDDFGQLLWLAAIAYVIAYAWFVARTALGVSVLVAAAVVATDLLLSYAIGWITAGFE